MQKFKVIHEPVFLSGNLYLKITQVGYDLSHAGSINQHARPDVERQGYSYKAARGG